MADEPERLDPAKVPAITLTRPEIAYIARDVGFKDDNAVIAVAIVWGESRGVSNAYRPASQNPAGGNDRGLVQFNDDAFPGITDAEAFSPYDAMNRFEMVAQSSSKGFGPWNYGPNAYGPKMNPPKPARTFSEADLAAARAAVQNPLDPRERLKAAGLPDGLDSGPWWEKALNVVGAGTGAGALGSSTSVVLDEAGNVVSTVAGVYGDVAGAALKILRVLASPDWWKRIGVGLLGALMIVGAIALVGRQAAVSTVGKAVGGSS